jgi:hypothetical protein
MQHGVVQGAGVDDGLGLGRIKALHRVHAHDAHPRQLKPQLVLDLARHALADHIAHLRLQAQLKAQKHTEFSFKGRSPAVSSVFQRDKGL